MASKDKNTKTVVNYIKSKGGKVPLSCFLLPPRNKYRIDDTKNFDYLSALLGSEWQESLKKATKRSNEYVCKYCKGTGFFFFHTKEGKEALARLVEDYSDKAAKGMTKKWVSLIFGSTENISGKIGIEFFDFYLGLENDISPLVEKSEKLTEEQWKIKNIAQDKVLDTYYNLRENFRLIKNKLISLTKKTKDVDVQKAMTMCPYCAGSGYYDVGHKFFLGKQAQMLLWLYNSYILNDKGKIKGKVPKEKEWEALWNQLIDVKMLEKKFYNFMVAPELGKPFKDLPHDEYDFDRDMYFAGWKMNQSILETKMASISKPYLTSQYAKIRDQGPETEFEETFMTIEEIKLFFDRLISTAPKDTGLLEEYLVKQRSDFIRTGADITYDSSQSVSLADAMGGIKVHLTRDGKPLTATPFIGVSSIAGYSSGDTMHFTIYAPTRLERERKKPKDKRARESKYTTQSMASWNYPYAMDYVPDNLLYKGKQKRSATVPSKWGSSGLEAIVKSTFEHSAEIIKNHFIIFFPMSRLSTNSKFI